MSETEPPDVTGFLADFAQGEEGAANRLLPAVYNHLRGMARHLFARQPAEHSLQPTALVHEAFIRLVDQTRCPVDGRTHFFNIAGLAMRQILTDHARRRRASKRGEGWERVELGQLEAKISPIDIVDLDDALTQLCGLNERQARIVELRYLAGLTIGETAEVLGVSTRTVDLDWRMARAWLRERLGADEKK